MMLRQRLYGVAVHACEETVSLGREIIRMGKRNAVSAAIAAALLLLMLSSCGKQDAPAETAAPVPAAETARPEETEPAATEKPAAAWTERKDGERFEEVIIVEGMEETVGYEHIRADTLGFEMDYDYARFQRISGSNTVRFVSVYDDPEDPENYLEVADNPRDAETVAAAVSSALSLDYEITTGAYPLDRAGSCIRIDASEGKGHTGTPDLLQMVYIIPAEDGCRVATAHYSFESAEGFGRRFSYMMKTFSVMADRGDRRMTEEQALTAIRRYCCIGNPDLRSMESSGEYSISWTIDAGDEQETVVLFRSYTGAQVRYHIDPVSGETYVTEYVPGVTAEEERTEESLNAWDYWF